MRRGITSRYNNQTWPLLQYFADRLGVSPKDAQRAAVVAMAREMIERDKRAIAETADEGSGVPTVPSAGSDAPSLEHPRDGADGADGGLAGGLDGATTTGP